MHLLPEGKKACRHCFDSFPQVTSQNEFTAAHSAEVLLIYGSALSRSASNLRLFCVAVCVNLLKLDIKNMDEIELSATNPKSCDGICGKEAKGCGLFYAPPPTIVTQQTFVKCTILQITKLFLCSCMVFFQYFLENILFCLILQW